MLNKGGIGWGIVGTLGGAAAGASFGWFILGPPTGDHHMYATLGVVFGSLIGFATIGPPRRWFISAGGAVGIISGGLIGGWFTQDEGLGTIGGILAGAALGLVGGMATAAWIVGSRRA